MVDSNIYVLAYRHTVDKNGKPSQ